MWSGGNLSYIGQAGGNKVRLGPSHRPKVLLIEPSYKFQLNTEKLLKKASCDSFLCLSVSAALDSLQKLMTTNAADNAFDLILVAEEVIESQASELSILRGKIAGDVESGKTIVAAMLSTTPQNLKTFSWNDIGLSEDVGNIPGGSRLFHRVSQKPMKSTGILELLNQRQYMRDDLYVQMGLTPESFITKINAVREGAISGGAKDVSMISKQLHLSIQDVNYKGSNLVR